MSTITSEVTEPRARATVLEAKGLSVGYHNVPVVHDLELTVGAGEVVALLGANGVGKTTTLRALAGHLTPIAGTLTVAGAPAVPRVHRRAKQGVAYVPEERSVISALSVRDNLRLGRGGVAQAVTISPELRPLLRRQAGLLSGGEQQILALTRALAARPAVLLADELSLGLAPLITTRLLRAVRDAAEEQALGVVLVEQHVRQALSVADRVYILQRGRVVMQGTAAEMRDRLDEIEEKYLSGAP